ncbi:MAG: hypothetical protein IKI11_04385 [Neisseriaceae bacterium]|nr:hypothetical protein [Neisseriaceae bacterium]
MIAYLTGILIEKQPAQIIVEVQAVGWASLPTIAP